MYKRATIIIDKLWNIKPLIIMCIIFSILNFCVLCHYAQWWKFPEYPEEVYKYLEEEAYNIIQNKNFDTEYQLTIMHYDNQSKHIEMKLANGSPTLTINVYNYGTDKQEITIKRDRYKPLERLDTNEFIIFFFSISILIAISEIFGILILSLIFLLITFIINKIKNK